ncbi:hypothetical protein [Aureispira sp. CCB-E]|uniref:hypothetical protein n=1 Tax=Aureispira sp. CCB-E TaxID=3051121 RepID=UPI00286869CA|nr:hypothetical protein [Aureispira sp. CCB-E]WMX17291.1 hypothetical protein QP953_13000 [Aureispira sp. CCB-E]
MKILLLVALLGVNLSLVVGQPILMDTVLRLTDKVSIKCSKDFEIHQRESYGPIGKKIDISTTMLIYNELRLENNETIFMWVIPLYGNRSVDVMAYAKKLEGDTSLSKLEKYELVAKKISVRYTNRNDMLSGRSIPFSDIEKSKYYYLDRRGCDLDVWRSTINFLGIKLKRKTYTYKNYWERYLLIDSIVYYFYVRSKWGVKGGKRKKDFKMLEPIFYDLVNGIIIKEEEEGLIKEE